MNLGSTFLNSLVHFCCIKVFHLFKVSPPPPQCLSINEGSMIVIQGKSREYCDMFDSIAMCLTENKLQKQDHKVRTADEPKEGRIMEGGQGARCERRKKKHL